MALAFFVLLASAAGGYFGLRSGVIPLPAKESAKQEESAPSAASGLAFVPLSPLTITLGQDARNTHLRFQAQLEVHERYKAEIMRLEPRFLDVLNGFLQALDARDIEDPAALVRLRAQMLRRMQVVAGEGRVRDLLVTEFVLN